MAERNEMMQQNQKQNIEQYYYTVMEEQEGMRLDQFLAGELKEHSRSYIQKLIKEGRVTVGDKKEKPGCRLKVEDSVVICVPPLKELEVLPEKMDLDIQIQKLKLLKANYLSEKYNLEDKIIKFYPQKIASLANTIKALEQDLSTAKAHPKPVDDSFVGMEINGEYISEKADAGKAILESCKQMNSSDPIKIGKYRGFDMELQLNLTTHFYEVLLKSATTQKVSLGDDPNGNITRIDNAIGRIPDHIENAKAELKNIQTQFETAQIEVQKPFAQEEELKAKTKRQIEVEKLISSGENEPEQNAISDYYYFSATDEQINALNNASIPFEKQTKADGSMVIRVATDDKSKAEAIMNSKNLIL